MTDSGYGCMNCKYWCESYGREYGVCRGLFCLPHVDGALDGDESRFISAQNGAKLVTQGDFFYNGWELDDGTG